MEETWKPIPGFEGLYDASNLGRIRSVKRSARIGSNIRIIIERILIPHEHYRGYLRVDLCKNGKNNHKFVHRLVAETFIPNPRIEPVVNHMDCNKKNNSVSNLEWTSYSGNTQYHYAAVAAKKRAILPVIDITADEVLAAAFG